jgi:hypothetical protein
MTHTLEGREATQAAAMGAIRSSSGAPEAVHHRRVRTDGDRPSGHETGPTPGGPLHLNPYAYRDLLREPNSRRFLTGLGVSSLGDAMSTVTVAWLAVLIAPADNLGNLGVFVGLAVASYTLPGVIGALALSPVLWSSSQRRSAPRSEDRS